MADVVISGTASLKLQFLHPGSRATTTFTPDEGVIQVTAFAAQAASGGTGGGQPGFDHVIKGKLDPNPQDGGDGLGVSIPQKDVRIEVALLVPPGAAAPAAAKRFQIRDLQDDPPTLQLGVRKDQARRPWQCRIKNVGHRDIRVAATLKFVAHREELLETVIPLRVLNNALARMVEAVGLTLRLNGKRAVLDVSDDLKQLSHGKLKQQVFDLPVEVTDLSLRQFVVRARTDTGKPLISFHLVLETRGEEINTPIADADVLRAGVTINVELVTTERSGRRLLLPRATVELDLGLWVDLFGFIGLGDVGDDLAGVVKPKIEALLAHPDYQEAAGRYLAAAFVEIAARGHQFHSLTVRPQQFVVGHINPGGQPRVIQPPHRTFPEAPDIQPAPLDPAALANLSKIGNIVVLMLENRSFDHMLGYLSHPDHGRRNDVDGLRGSESNPPPGGGLPVRVNAFGDTITPFPNRMVPATDFPFSPHHEHQPVLDQIHQGHMDGFVASFVERFPAVPPDLVMAFYTDHHLPTFDFLAANHLVCDRWFCSHPGPTQPNRFCTLSGRTPVLDNFEADDPVLGYLQMSTIFDLLEEAGITWTYFEHDVGFLRMYERYRLDDEHVIPFADPSEGFLKRAEVGLLPQVTFIDPDFVDVPPVRTANDDHAPASVARGQRLVAQVHDALVRAPQWVDGHTGTLLVITYDEHGGFFDHIPPPGTETPPAPIAPVHPEDPRMLGARVPAFVISPFVQAGAVSHTVFDHTSLMKTIALRFLGTDFPFFGPRVAQAAHLGSLLTREQPRTVATVAQTRGLPAVAGSRPKETSELPDDFHKIMRDFGRPVLAL